MESLQESHETDTTKQQRDGPMNTDLNDLSYTDGFILHRYFRITETKTQR